MIVELPLLNYMKIIEEVDSSPVVAAVWCQQACRQLGRGHRRHVIEYLVAAYSIACGLRGNEQQIERLAQDLIDGRTKSSLKVEKVRSEILHYLFIFIFFQSGMTTRNRATQYAHALQPYFDANTSPAEVEQRLRDHGPERLYRAAGRRNNLIRGAREWAEHSKDPAAVTMDEVLSAMAAENIARETGTENDVTDFGPRELPPDDDDLDEVEDGDESNGADNSDTFDVDCEAAAGRDHDEEIRNVGARETVKTPPILNSLVDLALMTIESKVGKRDHRLENQRNFLKSALVLAARLGELKLMSTIRNRPRKQSGIRGVATPTRLTPSRPRNGRIVG